MVDGEDEGDLDSDENEGEIGASQADSTSNAGSTQAKGSASGSAAAAEDSSQFVSSVQPSKGAQGAKIISEVDTDILGMEESKDDQDAGGWDQ